MSDNDNDDIAMIHRARKDADRLNCSVFGIGTDGHQWVFAAIDNNSEVRSP